MAGQCCVSYGWGDFLLVFFICNSFKKELKYTTRKISKRRPRQSGFLTSVCVCLELD